MNFYRGFMGVVFEYETPHSLNKQIELIQILSKSPNLARWNIPFPECQTKISATDWRILRSLQGNPRRSHVSIAQEIGLSVRTVARRLQRMVRAKALFAMCSLNPNMLDGTILGNLMVGHSHLDRFDVCGRISQHFSNYVWHVLPTMPADPSDTLSYTWFALDLPRITDTSEIADWAGKQNGVKNPRIELWEDNIVLLDTLERHLGERLDAMGID
jgi:hypothetical protein